MHRDGVIPSGDPLKLFAREHRYRVTVNTADIGDGKGMICSFCSSEVLEKPAANPK